MGFARVIVVDSSALVAIFFHEKEEHEFRRVIQAADSCTLTAANYMESLMVLEGKTPDHAKELLDAFMAETSMVVAPIKKDLVEKAFEAFLRYGKGRHKAALNICDCFSYALAKSLHAPLLFKGDDFSHTDIESAYV